MRTSALFLLASTLIIVCIAPKSLQADDPTLAIRLSGGSSSNYAVADIARLTFADDSLAVITGTGTDNYELETILLMEFCWPSMAGIDPSAWLPGSNEVSYLRQNRPNPFSPSTLIAFEVPRRGRVDLRIYSVEGRLVRSLVGRECPAGKHTTRWDGRDDLGRPVTSGVYFCKLRGPGITETRKMILVD
jgi:hypothetical protein